MKPLPRIALLFPAALLIAGIYDALVRGAADLSYFKARSLLTSSALERRPLGSSELDGAQSSLLDALSLEPANPLFVEQLGRVHEMRALVVRPGDSARRKELRLALEQFRAAAIMRPGSPYTWAAVAATKYRLDEMDFEFYGALQRAERYGRWEPAIQLELAELGFAAWPLLARQGKVLALEAVARAMPKQKQEIRRLAATHGHLELVCAEEPTLRRTRTGLCVRD